MSVIRASVTDQLLKITEAPLVASGGQNEVKITFTFCEKWEGFTKTATFYRDEDNVYHSELDENNTCIVPWEVYYESGTFYFGVFGKKDDVRRTSSTAKYRVKKGAVSDETMPSDPTPGVYEQIMKKLDELEQKMADFPSGGGSGGYILTEADKQEIAEQAAQMVEVPQGTGITDPAKNLLISILRNGVYSTDQSANITALESALASSGGDNDDSGGSDVPKNITFTQTGNVLTVDGVENITSITQSGSVLALA